MDSDFYPGMKVFLDGDYGIVTAEYWETGNSKTYGLIRWDTNEEADFEDWRGLFGSFIDSGGKHVEDYTFRYINHDGSLKKQ
ncbi:MAG TPA: hypothetical protein VK154_04090 [Chitinophagales bacterium]|nr:hypothetical protein [Chitinophagales bacterium]